MHSEDEIISPEDLLYKYTHKSLVWKTDVLKLIKYFQEKLEEKYER